MMELKKSLPGFTFKSKRSSRKKVYGIFVTCNKCWEVDDAGLSMLIASREKISYVNLPDFKTLVKDKEAEYKAAHKGIMSLHPREQREKLRQAREAAESAARKTDLLLGKIDFSSVVKRVQFLGADLLDSVDWAMKHKCSGKDSYENTVVMASQLFEIGMSTEAINQPKSKFSDEGSGLDLLDLVPEI